MRRGEVLIDLISMADLANGLKDLKEIPEVWKTSKYKNFLREQHK